MTTLLRTAACAALITLAVPAQGAEPPCDKNHYILNWPVECTWVQVGKLNAARAGHTATLLRDGRVLVAGGTPIQSRYYDATGPFIPEPPSPNSVELYDPQTGEWTLAAPLGKSRSGHTATLLADGRVLVVGGERSFHHILYANGTSEIFDPATGTWTPTGGTTSGRWGSMTATLLADGRVLLSGGMPAYDEIAVSAERYDPQSGQWTPFGDFYAGRTQHTATPLADGRVLFAAGVADDWTGVTGGDSDLYDTATGTWTRAAGARSSRAGHAATRLSDGRVLVSGGYFLLHAPPGDYYTFGTIAASEVYDPRTGEWSPAADLAVRRFHHTSTLLPDGSVLTVGGSASSASPGRMTQLALSRLTYGVLDSVEIRRDALQPSVATGSLNHARVWHTATLLQDGSVLIVGGIGADLRTLDSVELYRSR